MIYSKNGISLRDAYNANNQILNEAYDVNGSLVYRRGLKVMSYNVGGWYDGKGTNVPADKDAEYYALQNEMIARANPDVLCIQEYWGTFSKAGRTALSLLQQYFPYIHEQNKTNQYFGRCICSKYPISNYTVRTFTKENYRYFDSCTVTVDGTPITFVNTHPGLTQENRDPEIAQLIAYLQTQQTFISCGDYNTAVTTDDKTSEYWIKNIKPYLDAGFHVANCDEEFLITSSDYPDGTWNGCLDNIITSANITILSAEVDETKRYDELPERIDHMPFIAELLVPYASA